MHITFIPYGKRIEVENLLRDMEAQKFEHIFYKDKNKKEIAKKIWLAGSIRILPFGIYEYIFPEKDKDYVLTTLKFDENRYNIPNPILAILRKIVKCKKPKLFKKEKKFMWLSDYVNIIPIGIREDKFIEVTTNNELKGFWYEAL